MPENQHIEIRRKPHYTVLPDLAGPVSCIIPKRMPSINDISDSGAGRTTPAPIVVAVYATST